MIRQRDYLDRLLSCIAQASCSSTTSHTGLHLPVMSAAAPPDSDRDYLSPWTAPTGVEPSLPLSNNSYEQRARNLVSGAIRSAVVVDAGSMKTGFGAVRLRTHSNIAGRRIIVDLALKACELAGLPIPSDHGCSVIQPNQSTPPKRNIGPVRCRPIENSTQTRKLHLFRRCAKLILNKGLRRAAGLLSRFGKLPGFPVNHSTRLMEIRHV